jgi:hypothetical protein
MILENVDGTFTFMTLVRNRGLNNETVDHRENTSGKTGGKEGSTSFIRTRSFRSAPLRPPSAYVRECHSQR